MRRLKDYFRVAAWNSGVGYIALWAVTFWALDHGRTVFGNSGLCRADEAKVLFYWICDPATPLGILASVVNTALTVTVWSPVYIAAATVRPEAIAIAAPIVLTHLIGLPTAIFVAIRAMLGLLQVSRRILGRARRRQPAATPPHHSADRLVAARMTRAITRRSTVDGYRLALEFRLARHRAPLTGDPEIKNVRGGGRPKSSVASPSVNWSAVGLPCIPYSP